MTGKNPSAIFGKLGVLGNANLFLINPNGIVFGKNASLDINGSFSATTSPSILFNNGFEFSATNPQAPPLLKINLVPGLQYASQPIGNINNAGNLNVDSGKDISLFGNTVSSTGILNAPGGIVSVLGNIISLEDSARIDVSSQLGGGKVFIGGEFQGIGNTPTAKRTFIGSDVSIYADAINFGNGGDVIVWADEVTGFYGKISARGGSLGGNGGLVEVSGKQHLIFRGNVDTFAPIGNTGMLLLDPTDIIIANGSGDDAGDGEDRFIGDNSGILGSILSLPLSDIEDTAPTTIYESELENLSGNTNIVLQATNNITLQDLADDELNLSPGTGFISFAANVDNGSIGSFTMEDTSDTISTNGRDIEISGTKLVLGSIDTSFTAGNGGAITLKAEGDISTASLNSSSIPKKGDAGNGGAITLEALGSITVENLFSDSYAEAGDTANGGAITLKAGGDISTARLESSSFSEKGDAGNAGEITLEALGSITVENVFSDSHAEVGDTANGSAITLKAGGDISTARLDSSSLSEKGDAGNAGAITLEALGSITVENVFSDSYAEVGDTANGGAITLKAGGNISTKRLDSSPFSEKGDAGNGGAITLEAGGNISIEEEITSSSYSEAGSSGSGAAITLKAGDNISIGDDVISSSYSEAGSSGSGAAITLTAGGDIIAKNTTSTLVTSSISKAQNSGNGGNVSLEAQQNITGLKIVTLSSDSISGTVDLKGTGNLSIKNSSILTSTKFTLSSRRGDTNNLDTGNKGQSGNVNITSNGNLSFINSRIKSDTTVDKPAGNITISSSGFIEFTNSSFSSSSSSSGAAGYIEPIWDLVPNFQV